METMTDLVKKTSSPGREKPEGEESEDVSEHVKGSEKGELTQLKEPTVKDGALACGMWLEWLKLDIPPLSKTAGEYWEKVVHVVTEKYQEWQLADLMTKHQMKVEDSERVTEPRWDRLRARLAKLLLRAIPKAISDEIVTQRLMSVEDILFYILKRYQPGGVAEKSTLLQSVEKVGRHNTARAMSDEIIAWRLKMSRVKELGIVPPDPSRLVSEWIGASDELLRKLGSDSLTFRMQTMRMSLYIDTHPTEEALNQFLLALQSELANIALAEPSQNLSISQLNKQQPTKGNEKGQQQQKGNWTSKGTPAAGAATGTSDKVCSFYGKPQGCSAGGTCKWFHPPPTASQCINCGGDNHRGKECVRPRRSASAGEKGSAGAKGENRWEPGKGTKGADKGTSKGYQQQQGTQCNQKGWGAGSWGQNNWSKGAPKGEQKGKGGDSGNRSDSASRNQSTGSVPASSSQQRPAPTVKVLTAEEEAVNLIKALKTMLQASVKGLQVSQLKLSSDRVLVDSGSNSILRPESLTDVIKEVKVTLANDATVSMNQDTRA
jgi:hypothetical protein